MADLQLVQLIETMRVEPGGHIPLLAGHMRRLASSCRILGHVPPANLDVELRRYTDGLDASQTYRLRLLLGQDGGLTLTSSPLPDTPQPVQLVLQHKPLLADPYWLQHKTTHRPWYDAAYAWLAAHTAFFDIVFCNDQNQVCEASRSNIYIRDDAGRWLTPPQSCGLLPGVQRQDLLDRGLVAEAFISRRDLLSAPAIRVSNALRGWLNAVMAEPDLPDNMP
ncbi:aminotransferase class IV [Pollutimonas harenae]|uniref:Aminotransferase class IV n=1 Tax=Pollutimonas harenae TaxID=657015 RepID=A0A853GZW4_9BURK|nr:aminotransferase class IV [Pollutimonas harenae]NYT85320.1 aminotransferase class IV [Pollutimonas harenae]TEA70424.1 hypothetical protein ERD84_06930 [Pollutimonas harenae]